MSIRFYCPLGHRLRVPDSRAGKKGRCPICQQRVIVPVAEPQPSESRKRLPPSQIVHDPAELEAVLEEELGLAPPEGAPPTAPSPPPPPSPPLPPTAGPRTDFAAIPPAPLPVPPSQPDALTPPNIAPLRAVLEPVAPTPVGRRSWLRPALRDELTHRDPHETERRAAAYILAGVVAVLALASGYPALRALGAGDAPLWMPIVGLIATFNLVYALWLLTVPDWSTERFGTWLCGLTAVVYAAAMAVVLMTPRAQPLPLDLQPLRNFAGGWCGGHVLAFGLAAYGLSWVAGPWQHPRRSRARAR